MRKTIGIAVAASLALATQLAGAQSPKDPAPAAKCDKQVREYLETLKFIRTSAGSQIGDRVAAGYVPEESLRKVHAEQGPCAAAQLIREKTAARR